SCIIEGGNKHPATAHQSTLGEGIKQREQFSPIGSMISDLLRRLAWNDVGLRGIARYFTLAGLTGSSRANLKTWDMNIYSPEVSASLPMRLRNGVVCMRSRVSAAA
ncbi:MAG TPA: hypothetical protein PLA13_10175, partial [Microbacteriaceae bacterium]|nr:hypothetical protein [Microbacteriaceae bacterium]